MVYDVGIIGGGLGGLTLSIKLAQQGLSVVLFEKNNYPLHKVCGEYISQESWAYLQSCGIELHTMNLPQITELQLSAPNGKLLTTALPLGGFGISRYTIDYLLYQQAIKLGVQVNTQCKVDDVIANNYNNTYCIQSDISDTKAKLVVGSYGKRSNLDIAWQRTFVQHKAKATDNYVGVKYHIHTQHPRHVIGLHNFEQGYCGISQVEDDITCLCYLTTAKYLQQYKSISKLEQNILHQNVHLKKIFTESTMLWQQPLSISQVSFAPKPLVYNGIPLLGDAAGVISPLCGNGMSMAMHGSYMLGLLIREYFNNNISKHELLQHYQQQWHKHFSLRLKVGRLIQNSFGKKSITNIGISLLKANKWLHPSIIKLTHGASFYNGELVANK
jgi:menaquinone-9 beta-reductase